MLKRGPILIIVLFPVGCAETLFYKEDGKTEMPGLPFLWKDETGKPNLAYVKTTAGFSAPANFTLVRVSPLLSMA